MSYATTLTVSRPSGVDQYPIALFDIVSGELYDMTDSLDTAISMVNSGDVMGVAFGDIDYVSMSDIQDRLNYERSLVENCFNLNHVRVELIGVIALALALA